MIGHDLRPSPLVHQTDDVTDAPFVRRDALTAHRGPHASLADAVEAHLEGEKVAKAIVADVDRGTARPDALELAIVATRAGWGRAGLKGLARTIQKELERRPA